MDWTNKNSFLRWLVIILLALNILSLAFIWVNILNRKEPPGMRNPGQPPNPNNFMQKELNLSDAQAQLFETKRKELFSETNRLFGEMSKLQNELTGRLLKQQYDSASIDSVTNRIGEIQSTLEKLRFNHFKDLLSVCSPEQREKFISIIKKIMERKPPDEKGGGPGFPKENKPARPQFKP